MEDKTISTDIFASNELSVSFGIDKIWLDFKNVFPTTDHQNEVTNNIKHNVVIVDAAIFNEIVIVLKRVIKNYEKKYGKIPKQKIQKMKKSKKEGLSYVG